MAIGTTLFFFFLSFFFFFFFCYFLIMPDFCISSSSRCWSSSGARSVPVPVSLEAVVPQQIHKEQRSNHQVYVLQPEQAREQKRSEQVLPVHRGCNRCKEDSQEHSVVLEVHVVQDQQARAQKRHPDAESRQDPGRCSRWHCRLGVSVGHGSGYQRTSSKPKDSIRCNYGCSLVV